ncbi:glycosyltransferase family 4 protein [Pseudomonas sichuanensis]|uniref:MraY family glycosyltransferase n=1 Tax=Pseudomonas sichuanensis TaxID=2213015 RepID=UPI00244CAB9C|nr:glycosyltransferase family 4 protein [Pseudomonas sichuanensis]MDH0732191.1 glycosyltransferase family 4 protein [Pseudomonas sichuanensis]MDH1584880.1 glycosyltransferase family 4 protein [Pseudomonas sichuanensis]MDH1592898.1 glycosyltransferase family 4 protein [Pseudomonas sichuanensis]MDH1599823.1 glycosyltransferase family 4 protein [Pseudomonas sichuanensis]
MIYWLLPLIVVFSLVMTALLRRYALARSIIDIPNARSSHTLPTPRGGGVAIVVAFLLAQPLLAWAGLLDSASLVALFGAGLLVAVIGFMDDHGHIAARWRLLGHFCAAIWALAWLGGLPPLQVFGMSWSLGWAGHVLAAFYLVWMLNLYNFMDGIDGIASVEAITACLSACLLYWLAGETSLIWAPLLLAGAVAGFLFWNYPPARIFMGDAGSGFLGIVLGGLSLVAAWQSSQLFWAWLILLGVFVVDATFTLGRRLLRGEKVYEAHRSHGYQFASRRYKSHKRVTLAVLAINLLWLLPIAVVVVHWQLDGLLGLLIAYSPLLVLALKFDAGKQEN